MSSSPRLIIVGAGPSSSALLAQLRRVGMTEVSVVEPGAVEVSEVIPSCAEFGVREVAPANWADPLWYQRYAWPAYRERRLSKLR